MQNENGVALLTFLRIQSEYYEVDSSKYRLGITDTTLIPSLIHQTDKQFVILLEMSAMDPNWSRRRRLFESVGVPVYVNESSLELPYPRIEIHVGDDDFLVKNVVAILKTLPEQTENTKLLSPNGYLFEDGKISLCNNREDLVEAFQYVRPGSVEKSMLVSKYAGWIHVRHKMNLTSSPSVKGPEVKGLNWPGWNAGLVKRYSEISVTTATAKGCQLHPTRSKSVIYARGSQRKRRKK